MKYKHFIAIILVAICFITCKPDSSESSSSTENTTAQTDQIAEEDYQAE